MLPGRTYSTVDAYVSDLLALQNGRLATHPNAIFDAESCRAEIACRVTYRAAAHRFADALQSEGPFFLRIDDFHASNIFVDKDWNVTSLVDLDEPPAQPALILAAPYWPTGCDPGELEGEEVQWLWLGLSSVNAMHAIRGHHNRPALTLSMTFVEEKTVLRLWCHESEAFVRRMVAEYEAYCEELRRDVQ